MFEFLWTEKQNFGPPARNGHVMGYDVTRSRVVLFGGQADPVINNKSAKHFGATWEWDGLNWTQVSDVGPNPRMGLAMAFDYVRGRLILFGGNDGDLTFHRDTWEWDGEDAALR